MNHLENQSVGEIAEKWEGAIHALDKLGIDYCCAGHLSLKEACALANVPLDKALEAVEKIREGSRRAEQSTDWNKKTIVELIDYILEKHHVYTRAQLPRLKGLCRKVSHVHRKEHPELVELEILVKKMSKGLEVHMAKEETEVFGFVKQFQEAEAKGKPTGDPMTKGARLSSALRILVWEHGMAQEEFDQVNRLTNRLTPPENACQSHQTLYAGLRELEEDLMRHIQLEQDFLFNRIAELADRD
jgi:regulator of cell morphogenesis and NO signaling